MKKIIATLLVLIMVLGLVACGGGGDDTEEVVINFGIIQQLQHGSLDEAREGFIDGLAEAGYTDGENIAINYQNASGEVANCQQICELFANSDIDIVLAIATNAAQAAVNQFQESDVPVLFTAVTEKASI